MAAIPESISKGDILTHCFVEVNDENILNMGEYTMKSDGKPFFDVVSIFAANINVDSKTGRVHVFCNDQVSFLLRNADKFIRPLQAKGIKVVMSTPTTTTPIPAPASKHAHVPTSRVWFMSAARYLETS